MAVSAAATPFLPGLNLSLAWISIIAFAVAIIASCVSEINVGLLSIALAFLVGVVAGKMTVAEVSSGFPSGLFMVLVGVALFFSQASVNGTLEKVVHRTVKIARGNVGLMPLMFFAASEDERRSSISS